ncbi:MAG: response regulator transcription factor [Verrucomicrobiota bacterium]
MNPAAPTVLIADDHAGFRSCMRDVCQSIGAEVLECETGEEAVEHFLRTRPNWVLMDLEMEGMGGIEATREIMNSSSEARVIVVTNHDGEEQRAAAYEAGAWNYVNKDNFLSVRQILAETE